jgi:MFS family permease
MLSGVSKVGYSLASSWPMLIPLRVLDRFGKIRDAPRDAEVADDTKASERGRSFGIIDAFDHAGAVSGILASFFLLGALGYGQLFMIASIPPLFAAALVFLAIKEKRRGAGAVSFEFKLDSNFKRFLLASAFLALGSFSYSFVIIAAKDGFSEGSIPLLYLVMTLCAMAGAALFGRASDRFGRKRMMYVSSALLVLCAILIIVGGPAPLIVSFVAFGLHLGSIKPLQKTLASEIAPQDYKASALGTLQLISGLAALPASLAVGFLWEWVGPEAAFGFPILMVLLSALALSSVKE